jgi:UV DNA damage endonuclease
MSQQPQLSTRPNLGLVCITSSDDVRYRTITRKRLLQLCGSEQERVLRELYGANIERLNRALDFCEAQGIRLYRLTSALFRFAVDGAGLGVLT